MTLEDYVVLIDSMDVTAYGNSIDYGKPVLLLTVIEMIDKGVTHDNHFHKEDEIFKKAYQKVWDCCVDYKSTQHPDLFSAFYGLESDLFWHTRRNDQCSAYLDDELFDLLQIKTARDKITSTILKRFLHISAESFRVKMMDYISFSGTIYEDGSIQPRGMILLTSRPQWEELSPVVISTIKEQLENLQSLLSDEGRRLADTCIPTPELFYNNILLYISEETKECILPLKKALQAILLNIENEINEKLKYSCLSSMLTLAKSQIGWWNDIEDEVYYIQKSEESVPAKELTVANHSDYCILKANGEEVYETTDRITIVDNEAYTIHYSDSTLSISKIETDGEKYFTGHRIVLALLGSKLHEIYNAENGLKLIEQLQINASGTFYNICYDGLWYNHLGYFLDEGYTLTNDEKAPQADPIIPIGEFKYIPHGRYGRFENYTKSPYVNLLMMALVDTLNCPIPEQPSTVTFKELAFRMIANVWELLHKNEDKRSNFAALTDCIEQLISYSSKVAEVPLHWYSSKEFVYRISQTLPVTMSLRDTVDSLMNNSPFNLLRPWIKSKNKAEIMFKSHLFEDNCLYAIRLDSHGDYIEFNPRKKRMLAIEHDFMIIFYGSKFLNYEKQ